MKIQNYYSSIIVIILQIIRHLYPFKKILNFLTQISTNIIEISDIFHDIWENETFESKLTYRYLYRYYRHLKKKTSALYQ